MDDEVTGARADVALRVSMARDRLWELITDVTRVGEWSPECWAGSWLDADAPGPRPGARFEGRNRYPNGHTASVVCVVTEAVRPSSFAWSVLDASGDPERPASLWRYDLLPGERPGEVLVRHGFVHGPGNSGARVAALRDAASLEGRLDQLRRTMMMTLTAMTRCDVGRRPSQEESR